jgi:hypothetical protein
MLDCVKLKQTARKQGKTAEVKRSDRQYGDFNPAKEAKMPQRKA